MGPPRVDDYLSGQNASDDNPLFSWEGTGVGLGPAVASGTTSDSTTSLPPVRLGRKANAVPSPRAFGREAEVSTTLPEPDRAWVSNLVHLRRKAVHRDCTQTLSVVKSTKDWLRRQHHALEAGEIPVTLKCVLAASGVSNLFAACATDFQRPEYRNRYWEWSLNFIRLVDYYVNRGHCNVLTQPVFRDGALGKFVTNAIEAKADNKLSPHKEALLTSLGLTWTIPSDEADEDAQSSEENRAAITADETWELKGKKAVKPKPVKPATKKTTKQPVSGKRTRAKRVSDEWDGKQVSMREYFDALQADPPAGTRAVSQAYERPDMKEIKRWANHLLELRRFFKRGAYDIPRHLPYLVIWMNAQVAKSSTGTLSIFCCGILQVARIVVDEIEDLHIDAECLEWCACFLEFVDCMIEHEALGGKAKRPSQRLAEFLHECERELEDRTLSMIKEGLLNGVHDDWTRCDVMKACLSRMKSNSTRKRMARVHADDRSGRERSDGHRDSDGGGRRANGLMEFEDEVESRRWNGSEGHSRARKARKVSTDLCQQMVSSAITGIVAESIGSRTRTFEEREAERWVNKASVDALDAYADDWFQSADAP